MPEYQCTIAGRRGTPGYGAYCATKFDVAGFTQQCAHELAQYGIRVNCVAPGSHSTDMMDGTPCRGTIRYQLRAGDSGNPLDIANAAAGSDSSFVTGQTLNVDGGAHMS